MKQRIASTVREFADWERDDDQYKGLVSKLSELIVIPDFEREGEEGLKPLAALHAEFPPLATAIAGVCRQVRMSTRTGPTVIV